jgi:hypothetical protein
MNIKESNKLIAEFMGAHSRVSDKYGELFRFDNRGGEYGENALPIRYHQSWDWLMPVVDKIDTMDLSNIQACINGTLGKPTGASMIMYDDRSYICVDGVGTLLNVFNTNNRLSNTYECVVEFIKWYNKNKNNVNNNNS